MPFRTFVAGLAALVFLAGPLRADDPPRDRNVIVVTLDGFRHQDFFGGLQEPLADAKAGGVGDVKALQARFGGETAEIRREKLLPFLWKTVATRGQIFGDASQDSPAAVTNGLKFSYPGYSELFCGFGDPRVNSNGKVPNPNRSVLEFLDGKPAFRGKVAVYATWDVFPSIFRSSQNQLHVHAGWTPIAGDALSAEQKRTNQTMARLPRYWRDNVFDTITMDSAADHVRNRKPRVLFIGLGETDEWAHGRKYDLYLQSAHQADAYLAELWSTIQAMPEYRDRTSLIVTTDHGRGSKPEDWTSHGEKIDGAENIWIAVMGPDVPAKGVRQGVKATQSQVAATIAALVGEDFVAESPKSAAPLPVLDR